MSETKLRPCPFCGGKASDSGTVTYSKNHKAWFADGTQVLKAFYCNCVKCGANNQNIVGGYQTKELAIEKWNARPVEAELLTHLKFAVSLLSGLNLIGKTAQVMAMRDAVTKYESEAR